VADVTSRTQAHAVEAQSVDDAELEFQLQATILADSGFGSDLVRCYRNVRYSEYDDIVHFDPVWLEHVLHLHILDQCDRLDLNQDIFTHKRRLEAGTDRLLFAKVFGTYGIHLLIVRRIFQHDHDLEDVIHAAIHRLDALADVVECEPGLLLNALRNVTLVIIAADMAQSCGSSYIEKIAN
jgi:hypothetical protein